MIIKKNVGNTDKIIRIILAILAVVIYFTVKLPAILNTVLIVVAVLLVVTSFVSICPVYLPFGISTLKKPKQ